MTTSVETAEPPVAEATDSRLSSLDQSSNSHALDAVVDFVGGIAGGTASVYIGQPLDTVKVKLQTFPSLYKNAWDCFRKTLHNEGVYRGLYAGTVPSLAAQVSENAVLFAAYGFSQKAVASVVGRPNHNDLPPVLNAVAGGLAAFWSSLVLCPTELIKCKLQTVAQCASATADLSVKQPVGPWQLTKDILKHEGIRGMYRGFVPTLAREMPGYFFFFGGYECTRYLLTPTGKTKEDLGALATMAAGAMGGVSLWVAIFPADVIKSRTQVLSHGKEPGFIRMMTQIARHEGIKALYQGLGPTVLRTIPATAGLFLAYESTKTFLTNQIQREHSVIT